MNPIVQKLPFGLEDLQEILRHAAEIIRGLFSQYIPVTKKMDDSPLTLADMKTNLFLQKALLELMPQAGWLSEENEKEKTRLEREWVWIVDPLDGTKEFVRGVPEFAVSIGLTHQHQVVAAGVINPVTGEGGVGSAFKEVQFWGLKRNLPPAKNLLETTACISRTELEDGTVRPYLELVGKTLPVGSVAYKLLRVAAGVEDLTFSVQHKSEWDICGGVGLLKSVGKVYRRFDGNPLYFNQADTRLRSGAVAGPGELAAQFMARYEAMVHTKKDLLPAGLWNQDREI